MAASAVLVIAAAAYADDAPPQVTPDERFLRMQDRIAAQRLPAFAAYRSALSSRWRALPDGGMQTAQRTGASELRMIDGVRCVVATGAAAPSYVDAPTLEPPSLARMLSGALPRARTAALQAESAEGEAAALTVIGRATEARSSRYYRVTRVRAERIGATAVDHLRLVPRFAPNEHPWREAWIDPSDDRLVRARVVSAVRIETAPARAEVLLDLEEIVGVTTIVRMAGDEVVRTGAQPVQIWFEQRFFDIAYGERPSPGCSAFPAPKARE